MDSLGEVGKKMRSAIKAKLVELGNASQSGYIDDELPDYVMIMVANKRSKQQMLTDLNLFLGSNTESFVTWLHQVLQKLQEVTLPSSLTSKAKNKADGGKKDKKKDKKKGGKEQSITDVIAAELMEKAKRLDTIAIKKEEPSGTPSPPPAPQISNDMSPRTPTPPRISAANNERDEDDFDIPTISEISTSASNHQLHTKELAQLAELQNRIIETNKQFHTNQHEDVDMDDENTQKIPSSKPSIASRLGVKPTENSKPSNIIKLSTIRKAENEFATSTLKKFVERQKEDNDRRDTRKSVRERIEYKDPRSNRFRRSRSNSRDRNRRSKKRNSRSRSPIERSNERKGRISIRDRIGAHPRLNSNSKRSRSPENFKTKGKQRPALNSVVQHPNPGRSLLLRAVAEAQKSTSQAAFSSELKKSQHERITVRFSNRERNSRNEEEYVPEAVSARSESEAEYHPTTHRKDIDDDDENVVYLNNNDVDLDDLEVDTETQQIQQQQQALPSVSPTFIVSLDGVPRAQFDENSKSSKSPTPPPVIKRNKRKSLRERIGVRPIEQLMPLNNNNNHTEEQRQLLKRPHTEDEEEESESQRAYNKVKRTRVSPITFDLTDEENEDGKSRGSSCDRSLKKTPTKDKNSSHESRENGEEHTKRIRLEPSRSFDHVPALLSSVVVPAAETAKPIIKSKERCKFYPSCVNTSCTFHHPSLPCKIFPICKFGDSCIYTHPLCRFDTTCNRINCNFTHTPIIAQKIPNVASSIVPVQNYKSIQITPTTTICKYFPKCNNTNCSFIHPKICRFGKTCLNKFDCNFYHPEMSSKSKFKWVSPLS